jgi:hypothetical protein
MKKVFTYHYWKQIIKVIVYLVFEGLLDYLRSQSSKFIEDETSIHGKKTENRYLILPKKALNIYIYSLRPVFSPDINPIENCSHIMKQRIKARSHFPDIVKEI